MPVKELPNGSFEARYYDMRSRERRRIRSTRIEAEVEILRHAGKASADDLRDVSVAAVVEWYREFPIARGSTGRSEHGLHLQRVRYFANLLPGVALADVGPEQCAFLSNRWAAAGLADSYVASLQRACAAVTDEARRRGVVFGNAIRDYFDGLRPDIRPADTVAPSLEHVAQLRSRTTDLRRKILLELILQTRPSTAELAALRHTSDLDLQKRAVTYRYVVDRDGEGEHIRPARVRTVHFDLLLAHLLEQYIATLVPAGCPYLFPSREGRRLSVNFAIAEAKAIQLQAGLPTRPRDGLPLPKGKWTRELYLAPYSIEQLGNNAIRLWFNDKLTSLEIRTLVGRVSSRSIERFEVMFENYDADRMTMDAIDGDME